MHAYLSRCIFQMDQLVYVIFSKDIPIRAYLRSIALNLLLRRSLRIAIKSPQQNRDQ